MEIPNSGVTSPTDDRAETPADWDSGWLREPTNLAAPDEEAATPRWRAQEKIVLSHFGSFDGLRAIEIGAGRGTNAFLYAVRGATVTVLDQSEVALEQAAHLFRSHRLDCASRVADVFDLPADLRGAFDVSMSFGLCEHFLEQRRVDVVRAHLELVDMNGIAFFGVPNRWSPFYRLWMGLLKKRGTWPLGTEVPFTVPEMNRLIRAAGGRPWPARYGSFVASTVNHGLNQLLFKLGRRGLRVPQVRIPGVDRLAYELLVPAQRVE